MQIDFYEYAESVKAVEKFGLIDPNDENGKKSAFINYESNMNDWGAVVTCNYRSDYSFIAVDNNIPLSRK